MSAAVQYALSASRLRRLAEQQKARMTGTLSLSGQSLGSLPREIGDMADIQTLSLNSSQLTGLPPEIGQLTNLQTLSVNGNQLTSLPPEIGQLTNLQTLSVNDNQLTSLPPEIGRFALLLRLMLGGNKLGSLPPEIGQLTLLHTLKLADNELAGLPPEIGRLRSMKTLWLDGNQLASLPPQIGDLADLETLTLSENDLASLPAEIGHLANLETLALSENHLASLPAEIGHLVNLQMLSINGNCLTSLPAEIGQLTSLQVLALSENQLASLPAEMGLLANLHTLALGKNRLTSLPKELAPIVTNVSSLTLTENPFTDPLARISARGPHALAAYLSSLQDAVLQYEAKVLLVGEGNVGKTSLVAALRNEPFIEGRPTTHGIQIRVLMLRHPDLDQEITVRTWDFGGQEVYRITHQFFYSQRSLYLVVWNARQGQEHDEVEGWLRRIRLRAGDNVFALIVATHCDERRPEIDYSQLAKTFPEMLAGRFNVDSSTGTGIAALSQAITDVAVSLPQMGQLVSSRWIAVRDETLARAAAEPQISFSEFADMCMRHGVSDDEILSLAGLFHEIGHIIHYEDDTGLRDVVVLNPEWLTKAISYVLEDEETRENGGILDHGKLELIWGNRPDGPNYSSHYYPYFLRLMEKFDISYRLGDDQRQSLVAQLVPYERPDLPWDSPNQSPEGVRSLALICRLSEPAPGLMAWLTVRRHRDSTGKHWRHGVFLRYPIKSYASEALLEMRTASELYLEVRAPSPDFFFNVLRDTVEILLASRWPGLRYQLLIPCPTRDHSGGPCPGQFPLDFLVSYRQSGGSSAPCQVCVRTHDISRLLTGFTTAAQTLQPELEHLHGQVADIATSVRRMERYVAETAQSVRRVLHAISAEVTDCPRLFTLTPEITEGVKHLRLFQRRYRLVLWCEHPGHWHSLPEASYTLDRPKDWLIKIGPYITLIFKTLRLVVPVATSLVDVLLPTDQLEHAQKELDLMASIVAELSDNSIKSHANLGLEEAAGILTEAEGQALRAARVLLFEKDQLRAFGGMHRVQAPSGDFLWVCENHYRLYDPGLPHLS